MGYTLLEMENVPEALKNKPRWVTCVVFTLAVLTIVTSAISVGVLIGYTYCYLEHRTGLRSDNVTANFQIVHMPYTSQDEGASNSSRTINGALMSSLLISRILSWGQAIMEDEVSLLPWSDDSHLLPAFSP